MSTFALASLVHTDGSAVVLDGIQSDTVTTGLNTIKLGSDGNVYDTLLATMSQRPGLSYETLHIDQHLDHIGLTAKAVNTTGYLAAFLAENEVDSVRKSTGLKFTYYAGLIVPRSIRAQQDQPASLACEIIARKGSGGVPFAITTGQSLPAVGTVDEWYTLGSITVNGVAVAGVQDLSIDFGVDAAALSSDGDLYPTECLVQAVRPVITFTTTRADRLSTFTVLGTGDAVVVTLAKGAAGGRAGSGDMTFTTSSARTFVESIAADHAGRAAARVTVVCASANGSAHPLTRA